MSFTNLNSFIANVKKKIVEEVAKDAVKFELKVNEITKQAIQDLDAVDTGEMQSKTFVKSKINLNSNQLVVVDFKTQNSKYAIYVHEGLGTNRRYGRRPYLEIARKQLVEQLTTGSYKVVKKTGSPFKTGRKVEKTNKTGIA